MKFVDVLMLDIDGTMVGDVHYQVCQYDIMNAVAEFSEKKINVMRYKQHLQDALRDGLMHPDLEGFLRHHRKNFKFFVYTASETTWANTLVPCMEKVLGIKFNRPLFTREDCIGDDMMKNIDSVRARVTETIESDYVRVRNIFMIDNNKTLNQQKNLLIHCPSYNRRVLTDVFEDLHDQLRVYWDTYLRKGQPLSSIVIGILIFYGMLPQTYDAMYIPFLDLLDLYGTIFVEDHQILRKSMLDAKLNRCWSIMDSVFEDKSMLTIADVKNVNKELKLNHA